MPGRRARALLDDPNGCQAEVSASVSPLCWHALLLQVILSCCGPVQLVAGGCVARTSAGMLVTAV